jgi:hypothetical protein
MITELAKGKTLEEALKITRANVADSLGGLPPVKMHCSNLAADARFETLIRIVWIGVIFALSMVAFMLWRMLKHPALVK